RILGLNGHMYVQSLTGSLPDYDALTARIRMIPGIVSAAPIVESQALVSTDNGSPGVLVRGLRAGGLRNLTARSSNLSEGGAQAFSEPDTVVMGVGLMNSLGLRVGDTVRLLAPNGAVTPFGTTPRVKTYLIGGNFQVGVSDYDRMFIFMPLEEAQLFFNL